MKIAAENSYSVLLLIIRTISNTLRSQTSQKFSKMFLKIQNHTHTLLHKAAFIPKYFPNKSTKTPFAGHFLIIWSNGFFPDEELKTSLVEKTDHPENWEKKMEI